MTRFSVRLFVCSCLAVYLTAAPASGVIDGTVRDPKGQGLGGATVALVPEGSTRIDRTAHSDGVGHFRFLGLPAGTYAVTATAPKLASAFHGALSLKEGEVKSGLTLDLGTEACRIHGVVRDRGGHPLKGAVVEAHRISEFDGDLFPVTMTAGAFEAYLSPGGYRMLARIPGYADVAALVSLPAKDNHPLVLETEQEAPLGVPTPKLVMDWVRNNAIPLEGVGVGRGFKDLKALMPIIGNAHVVAFGEATHGTREFFQLKHRILEYLITEKGFTTIAIEAPLPEAQSIDDYILEGKGDPSIALKSLNFWTWDIEEVMELIQWMRKYNQDPSHIKKLRFYGFDIQSTSAARVSILDYLGRVDAEAANLFHGELNGKTLDDKAAPNTLKITLGRAQVWLKEFDAHRDVYIARSGREDFEKTEQNLKVIIQHLEMIMDDNKGNGRDRAMAENVRAIQCQEGKVILWAHNGHVSKDSGSSMGGYLAKALGSDFVVFGFAFNKGSFLAMHPRFGLRAQEVAAAPEGSLDATLSLLNQPLLLLDLKHLPDQGPITDWFQRRVKSRTIGSMFNPAQGDDFFISWSLARSYDALLFVEKSTPTRPNPSLPELLSPVVKNLNFLLFDTEKRPLGWRLSPQALKDGYKISIHPDTPNGACAELASTVDTPAGSRGFLIQSVDAKPFRGRTIHLKGRIRADLPSQAVAGFCILVTRPEKNVYAEKTVDASKSAEWTSLETIVQVDEDATELKLGVLLRGEGRVLVDSLSLETK
jgi:erythromycin esterase